MITKTENIGGLPNCYRYGQMIYFRHDGHSCSGILEDGKWEGNNYILHILLKGHEKAKDTIIRVDNKEVI